MKTISFTGKCPQCELYDDEHYMRENDKNLECPNCNLMILIEKNKASIFRHRGKGEFKMNFNTFMGDATYQEVDEYSYPNGTDILLEKHLIEYLLLNVNQKDPYSIDKLIDSYVDYKFNDSSETEYMRQSNHFSIDFDNESIVQVLKKRDQEKNLENQYTTERLYYFLLTNIFPKYQKSDNSWLPEMGMSHLQMYLCKKHFPDNERELINSDPTFIKQSLKGLIKDLIDIIYHDKIVLLSGDIKELQKITKEMYN